MSIIKQFVLFFKVIFICANHSYSFILGSEEELNPLYVAEHTSTSLSIDGGGIRGILPSMILENIQKRIDERFPTTRIPLIKLFDVTGGTSTGGLIALALNRPHDRDRELPYFTAAEIVKKYEEYGPKIFSPDMRRYWTSTGGGLYRGKYNRKGLEDFLKECCGDYTLADSLSHLVIPVYDKLRKEGSHFCSDKAAREPENNFDAYAVGLSTTAAPTYFDPYETHSKGGKKIIGVDGGVINNNPSALVLAAARESDANKNLFMLSIGTGRLKEEETTPAKRRSSFSWIPEAITNGLEIAQMFMEVQPLMKEQEVERTMRAKKYPYYRIQFELPSELMAMDNGTVENIHALKAFGRNYIIEHDELLQKITDELLALRLINEPDKV